jgi:lysophospholipase L1-like esterase
MRRDRPILVGGLLTVLLFAGACASSGTATDRPGGSAASPSVLAVSPTPVADAPASPSSAPRATLPAGALRIVALGDSLTEGQGDDSGRGGYPGRLKPLIDARRSGTTIVNVGHSGWSSTDLIEGANGEESELTRAIAAQPNVALVWIGSNDLWYLYEFGPEPMTAGAEQADLAAYEANLDTILSRLTSRGAAVYIALLDDQSKRPVVADPPNPAEPAFPATTAADLALMSRHVKAYNDVIARKAAQYGATTVDFYHTTIFTDAATLYGDGNHPNEAGYDAVTQVWFAALEPELK